MRSDYAPPRKSRRALCSAIAVLVLSAALVIPCRSADLPRKKTPQVKPPPPQVVAPKPTYQPSLQGDTQGTLSVLGKKVSLRLNRSVSKVEVFSGRKKLTTLGAGTTFDITPYLPKATGSGLTFYYYGSDGRKSSQIIGPGKLQTLARQVTPQRTPKTLASPDSAPRLPKKSIKSPATSSSAVPASGRTLSTNPRMQAEGVSIPGAGTVSIPQRQQSAMSAAGIPNIAESDLSSIFITKPDQGDFMVEGGQFAIQWSAAGNIPNKCVHIDLFQGIYHVTNIAHNVCVNGYNWQLPTGMFGTNYEIRIRTADNAYTDDSESFSILSATPDLKVGTVHGWGLGPPAPTLTVSV